jgi:DNA-binding SARP family transcriptional activator
MGLAEGITLNETLTNRAGSWRHVNQLLESGQYEPAGKLLRQVIKVTRQIGEDEVATSILTAAQQICLLCSQARAEIEWHAQAARTASQREQELSQRLLAMLALVDGGQQRRMPPKSRALSENVGAKSSPSPSAARVNPGQDPTGSTTLAIHCFGSFQVYRNNQLLADWTSLKARSILKYLVAHQGTLVAKDILMDVFWPEADPEAARRNLHQAIYSLRRTFKQGCSDFQPIQYENDCYFLDPDLTVWLDYVEFEQHVQAGRRFEAAGQLAEAEAEFSLAEGLYKGDFLEEDRYEDWPQFQREYFRSTYLDLADRLSQYYIQQERYTAAETLCKKILIQDHCDEKAHRRLIHCYLRRGQRSLALKQYETCVQVLETELGVPPSTRIKALYEEICEGRTKLA